MTSQTTQNLTHTGQLWLNLTQLSPGLSLLFAISSMIIVGIES